MNEQDVLTPLLIELATQRFAVQTAKAEMAQLAGQEEAVQVYLQADALARQARQDGRTAYQQLADTAVTLFDDVHKELHPCVTIALYRTAQITRHDVALLWLLCNAADTVDLLHTQQMTGALETMGKAMNLVLRRRQALAIVEEIFSDAEGNPLDVITFARPMIVPKARIARDLSSYVPGGEAHTAWQAALVEVAAQSEEQETEIDEEANPDSEGSSP